MQTLPFYISLIFILTTIVTLFFFFKATHSSKTVLVVIITWLVVQTVISLAGFYTVTDTVPPRFAFLVLPPMISIVVLFISKRGRAFIDGLDIRWLTILHVIRIPVELVLFLLFTYKYVPQIMTFEGRNLDILSGISALFIYYFGFIKKKISNVVLITWNILCLFLLINIVSIAILSAPFTFQRFGIGQPNIALLYFPFIWLPCCIVPVVLFSHMVSLRFLFRKQMERVPGISLV
ncbi:MAG: hypothetical protein QM764_00770 [Chitinophagaceae bacterium]